MANGGTMWNQNKNEYSINDRKNPSEFIEGRKTTESYYIKTANIHYVYNITIMILAVFIALIIKAHAHLSELPILQPYLNFK